MRFHRAEYPSINDIVFVSVQNITNDGNGESNIYVELVEYDLIKGLILPTEISKKKTNVSKLFTIGKIYPAVVMNVDTNKKQIDLSYKNVPDSIKPKLDNMIAFYKKIHHLVTELDKSIKASDDNTVNSCDTATNIMYPLFEKITKQNEQLTAEQLYTTMLENPEQVFRELENIPYDFIISELNKRIKTSDVAVFTDFKLQITSGNAITTLKSILTECSNSDKVKIEYIGSPNYRISVTADTMEDAQKLINETLANINTNELDRDFYCDNKLNILRDKKYSFY